MRRRRPGAEDGGLVVTERPVERVKKMVKKLDMYARVDEQYTDRTGQDSRSVISLAAWVVTAILMLSEIWSYRSAVTQRKEHMLVDTSLGQKLRINMNITFPALSCVQMHVDAMDVAGDYHPYMEANMVKQRLDSEGRPVGKVAPEEANVVENKEDLLPPDYCGSCYGAGEHEGECCNSCDALVQKYSLKGWSTKEIRRDSEQCKRELKNPALAAVDGEGCNLSGFMLVNKVAGNFHVALGESVVRDGRFIHQFQPQDAPGFNASHIVHSLSFGEPYPGMLNPLDATHKILSEERGTGLFQYFIKLVPTVHEARDGTRLLTNQFSFTERFRPLAPHLGGHLDHDHNKHGSSPHHTQATTVLPGVFWVYDLSAFMVEISYPSVPFTHFLARLCAVAGGVFTISGFLDSVWARSRRGGRSAGVGMGGKISGKF